MSPSSLGSAASLSAVGRLLPVKYFLASVASRALTLIARRYSALLVRRLDTPRALAYALPAPVVARHV